MEPLMIGVLVTAVIATGVALLAVRRALATHDKRPMRFTPIYTAIMLGIPLCSGSVASVFDPGGLALGLAVGAPAVAIMVSVLAHYYRLASGNQH